MRRPSPPHRSRLGLARAGAVIGLLVYLLPLTVAMPRPAAGGAVDRAPGIVHARQRQVQHDAAADQRPVPWLYAPILPPAYAPAVSAPEAAGCPSPAKAPIDVASPSLAPGAPRAPPIP